jgi:hypothetical protein
LLHLLSAETAWSKFNTRKRCKLSSQRCVPRCEVFQCGQRALIFQKNRAYCRWADDQCSGPDCNYASCGRGRLLANGTCGLNVKRKTRDETGPEAFEAPPVKLRKLRRRIREDALF